MEPVHYPRRIMVAQFCGALMSLLFFVESYYFPRRDVPWPYIMFWTGVVTLLAALLLTFRSRTTAVIGLVYFEILAFLSISSLLIALSSEHQGPPVLFLVGAGLNIAIVVILMQKSTQAYYRNEHAT